MKFIRNIFLPAMALLLVVPSCKKDFLELDPRGTQLETNFYSTQEELFQGLVATYDVLGWQGTDGWTMDLGLLNAASDDCYAGGSDASDQPSWVAWDGFTLNPLLGPQLGLWRKGFSGIYRANLLLQKIEEVPDLDPAFKARTIAEAKFLRAWFYFDLVRLFGNIPIFTEPLSADEFFTIKQATPSAVYDLIEQDLKDARNTPELPQTVPPAELGRVTKGAVNALLGKVLLYRNDDSRMLEAAGYFEDVINSGNYFLMPNYGDIFKRENEWGPESVFEIQFSDNRPGDWGCCFASGPVNNATEGNYNVQFFGMRDYSGPLYAPGWSFCPISTELVDFMQNDPRFEYTIIDGNALKQVGATYTEGYQNTDYFIKKYAPLADGVANDGVIALEWADNIRAIRYADVLLMAAEAQVRGNGDMAKARQYLNQVRARVSLQPYPGNVTGEALLNAIYLERRFELATEGHRFFDLVRTGKAAEVLPGFQPGKHEYLPIPQQEIELSMGALVQNPGY
ncbi:MAG: RagB/SusD family nutrient uptake outer membrane protein [Saprospirales bacterium]|nr:RagB/SusD family nutrient uptake outer membrane protein [Saprospirales bacterium]